MGFINSFILDGKDDLIMVVWMLMVGLGGEVGVVGFLV